MKTFHYCLTALVATSALAMSVGSAFAAGNPNVDHEVQAFLQKLEAGGGKPIEQLPPSEARKVLAGAQFGVKLTLPGPMPQFFRLGNKSSTGTSAPNWARPDRCIDAPISIKRSISASSSLSMTAASCSAKMAQRLYRSVSIA